MTSEETNDIVNERDCGSCVWRSEHGCTVWDCDYISRKTLYKWLEAHPEIRGDEMKDESLKCTETHSCDCERTETHDWTPVSEALPRDDEDVIVTCLDDSGDTPYSYTAVAWHYNGTWVCDNMRCPFVIAWLSMPDPWKGEEHEL